MINIATSALLSLGALYGRWALTNVKNVCFFFRPPYTLEKLPTNFCGSFLLKAFLVYGVRWPEKTRHKFHVY